VETLKEFNSWGLGTYFGILVGTIVLSWKKMGMKDVNNERWIWWGANGLVIISFSGGTDIDFSVGSSL
jgi:hypothetical protein